MALIQVIPMPGNLEHDLRIDSSASSSILHGQAGLLQHLVTLLLALEDGPGYLVRVESVGIVQTGQGQVCSCRDYVVISAPASPVCNVSSFWWCEVTLPGTHQE
jgi:hypothetical protein